ncbi:hypothetical protein QFC20_004017 [Naganishia adeliensis]|uniref:Uncharacterized protein n=1 Tax=Naganishia adeliensis TaxID=92952 RepID=A0ACC2W5J0_9TREE|nr:hypothetical protein QFC20_004017 [Naganishia adeliensis]
MSSLRQARTRTSARNNAVNPPADANANAAVAATRGRNRSAAARAPAARRVVAPRPTAAGMRALQDALDAQRQEAEELREQMRQFIAENGNGGGGNENGQGGNGGGEGDQQRPDQEGDDEQDQGGGQGRDRDGQGDHNMEGTTGARSDNELGNFRMEVDAKFNAIMDAINKGSDGTPTGARGANGNPSLGSNGLYGAFPGYQAGLPGMNGAAP